MIKPSVNIPKVLTLTMLCIVMTSCQIQMNQIDAPEQLYEPTPTLFGTPIDIQMIPTDPPTPEPEKNSNICVFPFFNSTTNNTQEAAVYTFNWNASLKNQTIKTRDGTINLTGPTNLKTGIRKLLLVHNGIIPDKLYLSSKVEPNSHIIYDAHSNTSEIRTENGDLLYQTIYDPTDDTGNMKSALNITKVERQYSEDDNYIIRVTLDSSNVKIVESSFENIELKLGQERYAYRILNTQKAINLKYDSDGNYSKWTGTVIVQGNTITWAINNNKEENFSVKTSTDIQQVDKTNIFNTTSMLNLWAVSQTSCITQ